MAVRGVGLLLLGQFFLSVRASHHWKVTEGGRIQSQVENSGFPLTRQDDILAVLEQEHRLNAVSNLYKQLMSLKKSIDRQWFKIEGEGDLEKRLYSSDIDCLLAGIPLSEHNLNTEFLDYGQGSRPKMKNDYQSVEPDCTAYSKLDFSMRTFPHLETLNRRSNFNLTVNPVPSKTVIDFNIDAMLKDNSSDWTAYNIASLYWRTMGNGTQALECARRALYFSPRNQRYIVLLNLGTLLQELRSLGEAAIVLHSAVDHDPIQDISHLALGNVYAALGDYKRSLACYENVLSLNPGNTRALQLKHALLCHKKLELGLLEIHAALQSILQDLQKLNALHEEWLFLQNQVDWERDSNIEEFFSLSQPVYLNLQMLLQNVEHQAKTLNEEVSKRVPRQVHGRKVTGEQGKPDCLPGDTLEGVDEGKGRKETERSRREAHEEEGQLENLVSAEHLLKNKMNSLITFIKTNYEKEINGFELKTRVDQDLALFKNSRTEGHFPANGPLPSALDACVKDSNNVKKLN